MNERRGLGNASLLLLGLLLGVIGGLYYAWLVDPVVFVDASPARLSDANKVEYLYLVSQSLAATGNEAQAQQRLAALADPDLAQTVANLLDAALREQRDTETVAALAQLARLLGVEGPTVDLFAPQANATTPNAPLPTPLPAGATPLPSPTPLPTAVAELVTEVEERPLTPTPAPSEFRYRLLTQEPLCGDTAPLLAVITLDALLEDLPGVEVAVRWENGRDRFYTGFKPEARPGYGDFTMQPGVVYTVQLVDGGPEIPDLQAKPCADGSAGGWLLTFQNLVVTP
ncbi:MAG: hypothetical protein KDE56_08055 [Anaerolineales bacterium]|nr:hypothetical protein [Anaerolineales bacterium]